MKNNEMIRQMKKNKIELERVCQIWLNGSIKFHDFVSDNPEQFWRLKERNFIIDTLVSDGYIYENEGNIIGFITINGNCILELFVDEAHQGKKIGPMLINVAQQTQNFLKLNVYDKNKRALHVYEKCGFKKKGEPYPEDKTGCMKWWMEWEKNIKQL